MQTLASTTAALSPTERIKPCEEEKKTFKEKILLLNNQVGAQPNLNVLCKSDGAVKEPHQNTASLCLPFLPTTLSSVSPYYFEKVGVILRVESNPSWQLIKGAAPTLVLGELWRNWQLWMSIWYTGCFAFFVGQNLFYQLC